MNITTRKFRIYESLPEATCHLGGGEAGPHWENAGSRIALSLVARLKKADDSEGSQEPEEVLIWLTVPQIAAIVWCWFQSILPQRPRPKEMWTRMLSRLMKVRWNHMTSPTAMGQIPDDGAFNMPHYFRVPTGPRT